MTGGTEPSRARLKPRPEAVVETFGEYGGRYVPETLIPALDELAAAWEEAKRDSAFRRELEELGRTYVGRPSPITRADRFAPLQTIEEETEEELSVPFPQLAPA